jgi:predicted PurR-regulated permease PerM
MESSLVFIYLCINYFIMTWNNDKTYRLIGGVLFVAFIWYFTEIVMYMVIASIIGVAGQPMVKLLRKIKIGKIRVNRDIAATISLLTMIALGFGFLGLLGPVVNTQANQLKRVDVAMVSHDIGKMLKGPEKSLKNYGLIDSDDRLETIIANQMQGFATSIQIDSLFSSLLSMTGTFIMGIFSVLFMSFFFIKDDELFNRIVMLFIAEKNQGSTNHILRKIKKALTRYFLGIAIEVSSMMILITIGGLILGLKNALLIGFIGGLMNVIPYLGPLIGASIASILVGMTTVYVGVDYSLTLIGGTLIVFEIANMIDNFLLQPIIYSNSVSAHPMEIFIVIIMAGTLGGPLGMIAAIPIYTVVRITAKEFLGEKLFVKRLMKDV